MAIKEIWEKFKWYIIAGSVLTLAIIAYVYGWHEKVKDLALYYTEKREETFKKVKYQYKSNNKHLTKKEIKLNKKLKEVKEGKEKVKKDVKEKSAKEVASEFIRLGY